VTLGQACAAALAATNASPKDKHNVFNCVMGHLADKSL
jgi:hypothetical protein